MKNKNLLKVATAFVISFITMGTSAKIGHKIGDHYDKKIDKEVNDLHCEFVEPDEKQVQQIYKKNFIKTVIGSIGTGAVFGIIGGKLIKATADYIDKK